MTGSRKRLVVLKVLMGCALLTGVAGPARAGFEWSPPAASMTRTAPGVPPAAAMPAMPVDSESINGGSTAIDPDPLQGAGMIPLQEEQDKGPALEAFMKSSAPVAIEPVPALASSAGYETIEGFGESIPLALALSQIVPSGFSYGFGAGVDPGLRVSWNGGKPWNIVLDEALQPLGMHAVIAGARVSIRDRIAVLPAPQIVPASLPVAAVPTLLAPPAATPVAVPASVIVNDSPQSFVPQSYPRRVPPQRRPEQSPQMPMAVIAPSAPAAMMAPPAVPMTASVLPIAPPPPPAGAPLAAAPLALTPAAMAMPVPVPVAVAGSVPAMPSAMAVMDPLEIGFWQAEQGESLRQVLSRWAASAQVAMLWNSSYDYILAQPVRMHGTFADVVTQTLASFGGFDPRPMGRLHPNLPQGPSVLVVENYTAITN